MLSQDIVGLLELMTAVGVLAILWIGLNRKPMAGNLSGPDPYK
jgi:hypothetical protein